MRLSIPVMHLKFYFRWLPAALLGLGLAGCSSSRPAPDVSVKDTPIVPTAMMARGSFFAGKIEAEALLGAGVGFGSGRSSGRRGFFGRNAPPRETVGGIPIIRDGVFDESLTDEPVFYPAPGSTLPPVQLRLRLTNTGAAPVQVDILDFNSALGNFSVQPPKLLLAAGESREVEPMSSRLGVTADEIPLTVRLRIEGQAEQQVLKMQLVKATPKPAASPAAPTPPPAPAKAP
jgi:hypothetical protein